MKKLQSYATPCSRSCSKLVLESLQPWLFCICSVHSMSSCKVVASTLLACSSNTASAPLRATAEVGKHPKGMTILFPSLLLLLLSFFGIANAECKALGIDFVRTCCGFFLFLSYVNVVLQVRVASARWIMGLSVSYPPTDFHHGNRASCHGMTSSLLFTSMQY